MGKRAPIPLFPRVSYEYAKAIWVGKSDDAAFRTARSAWNSGYEVQYPEIRQLFRNTDPLGEEAVDSGMEFKAVALRVFLPLLESLDTP